MLRRVAVLMRLLVSMHYGPSSCVDVSPHFLSLAILNRGCLIATTLSIPDFQIIQISGHIEIIEV
jgi:hypothetical protein